MQKIYFCSIKFVFICIYQIKVVPLPRNFMPYYVFTHRITILTRIAEGPATRFHEAGNTRYHHPIAD